MLPNMGDLAGGFFVELFFVELLFVELSARPGMPRSPGLATFPRPT